MFINNLNVILINFFRCAWLVLFNPSKLWFCVGPWIWMLHRSRPYRDSNLKLQKIGVKGSKLLPHLAKRGFYSAAKGPQQLWVKWCNILHSRPFQTPTMKLAKSFFCVKFLLYKWFSMLKCWIITLCPGERPRQRTVWEIKFWADYFSCKIPQQNLHNGPYYISMHLQLFQCKT